MGIGSIIILFDAAGARVETPTPENRTAAALLRPKKAHALFPFLKHARYIRAARRIGIQGVL
jgi:hypothetical protein